VQGWSTSCVVGAHKNRIVLRQVGVALQGNVRLTCNDHGLSPFGQAEKGSSRLHNQVWEKWIEPR